jgi:hypothetical protein
MTTPNAGRHRITRKGFVSERDLNAHADSRWLWMACRVAPDLWDDEG